MNYFNKSIKFNLHGREELSGDYYLVPITLRDVLEDWQIVLKNADIISKIRGTKSKNRWPYTCSLEENYQDLSWLQVCAKNRQLFSFIIRRKIDQKYAGCIYINPINIYYPEKKEQYDIDFWFWIVRDEFENGNYDKISRLLLDWLCNYWKFDQNRIYFRNKLKPSGINKIF